MLFIVNHVQGVPISFLIQSGKAVHSSVINQAAQFPFSKVLNIFLDDVGITKDTLTRFGKLAIKFPLFLGKICKSSSGEQPSPLGLPQIFPRLRVNLIANFPQVMVLLIKIRFYRQRECAN